MYRNRKVNNKSNPSTSKQPIYVSQKKNLEKVKEKENEDANVDFVPNSQSEEIQSSQGNNGNNYATQSKFLSQRHQYRAATQYESQIRGKNFFEISLISTKIKVTDIGCELVMENDDPVSFIRRFRSFITNHKENSKKFIEGFEEFFHLNDPESLEKAQKFLSGIIIKEAFTNHQSHTSLIQCFFAVASLRDEISRILLENLKKYVTDKAENAESCIVGLIVAQFKFSDQLLTSESYNLVYEEFFSILRETQNDSCREVIISNFRDFDEFKHDDAVKRLLEMYEDDQSQLTPFIETFTEMCISDETKSKISNLVQYVLKHKCDSKMYPGIVKYLIYYSNDPGEVVESLRENLKWKIDSSMDEIKSKVLRLLEKSIRRQKSKISDHWIKFLTSFLEDPRKLKPIDFIALLMIINVREEKFQSIKKIFIQNIPKGFFKEEYLKNTFALFPITIAQYSDSLIELLSALQKISTYEINEFSRNCFKELFKIEKSDKKEIVGTLIQFLCEKAPRLPFSPRADFKVTTLNIFDEIAKEKSSAEDLLLNHKILLRVLDLTKVQLSFIEHRLFMELLCTLAYKLEPNKDRNLYERKRVEEEQETLREHLEMTMKKLLCNPEMRIKQLGIIGTIKIISSLVVNYSSDSEVSSSESFTIEDLPEGNIKEAANLSCYIFDCVKKNSISLAMIYDEFSLEFQAKRVRDFEINILFLQWISELLISRFDGEALISLQQELKNDIPLSNQFFIECNHLAPAHAVKLGLLIYDERSDKIVFICALFKLVRLMFQHRYGGLNSIQNYSISPLTLTEDFAKFEDELSSDEELLKMKLDLYFHTVNWLREIIGAFCHWNEANEAEVKKIIKNRLKQLIKTEEVLLNLLKDVSINYYPPPSTFLDIEIKKRNFDNFRKEIRVISKPPTKKKKKNDSSFVNVNESVTKEISIHSVSSLKLHQFCREIDPQFIILLGEKYEFTSEELSNDRLGLRELHFMLQDTLSKISVICNPKNAEQKGYYDPIAIIRDLKEVILVHLVKISYDVRDELIEMSMRAMNEDDDRNFYTKDSYLLKNCLDLVLNIFDEIFSCQKLRLEKTKDLLVETLKVLVTNDDLPPEVCAIDEVCEAVIAKYESFQNYVKSCDSAYALVRFLTTISKLSGRSEHRKIVTEMCEKFLKTSWKDARGCDEHGSTISSNLEKLLQIYIEDSDIKTLKNLVDDFAENVEKFSDKKVKNLVTFPSFNRMNSTIIIRVYLTKLSKIISTSNSSTMNYNFWFTAAQIMSQFVDIIKILTSQSSLIVFVRNFLVYIKFFNVNGMNILKNLINDEKKFVALAREMQKSYRHAHGITCELKHRKNKSITTYLPMLRQSLTKYYSVMSALLSKTDWDVKFGELKNFDLHGNDIASQNSTGTPSAMSEIEDEEEEEEDVEELPSPNVSDDETIGDLEASVAPPPRKSSRGNSARSKRSTIVG